MPEQLLAKLLILRKDQSQTKQQLNPVTIPKQIRQQSPSITNDRLNLIQFPYKDSKRHRKRLAIKIQQFKMDKFYG